MKEYYQAIRNTFDLKKEDMKNTFLLFYAHVLPSNYDFFCSLVDSGFDKDKIYILGKSHSTVPSVENKLKHNGLNVKSIGFPTKFGGFDEAVKEDISIFCKEVSHTIKQNENSNIIIVESGGLLRREIAKNFPANKLSNGTNIFDVELTTQGTYFDYLFPTVEVALSKAKTELENDVIAQVVFNEMKIKNLLDKKKQYGIVGYGTIGKGVEKTLQDNGYKVVCYDKNSELNHNNYKKLYKESDVIIGATGKNIMTKEVVNMLKPNVSLISASSKDIEFSGIFNEVKNDFITKLAFEDRKLELKSGKSVNLITGGFPITFDKKKDCADVNNIKLTYGLWISGILQASKHLQNYQYSRIGIDLTMNNQINVVKSWKKFYGDKISDKKKEDINSFLDNTHQEENVNPYVKYRKKQKTLGHS